MPDHAVSLRRDLLDARLRHGASDAGATVLMGHRATAPIVERGFVRGAALSADPALTGQRPVFDEVRARFVVVADGANSSFGRDLGTTRRRNWPYGIATRTYFTTPRTAESWIESDLGIADAAGNPIAGYGWVIPIGDGTVNVGVGVLSTYRDVRGINALKLLDSFAHRIADRWELDPNEQLKAPTRFRVPLAGSVGPKMGPTFLVVGDAAGAASPFNGDGVDAALMSGRLAAEVLSDALGDGNSTTLQRYPTMLADELGRYHQVGRLSARFLGRPAICGRRCVWASAASASPAPCCASPPTNCAMATAAAPSAPMPSPAPSASSFPPGDGHLPGDERSGSLRPSRSSPHRGNTER